MVSGTGEGTRFTDLQSDARRTVTSPADWNINQNIAWLSISLGSRFRFTQYDKRLATERFSVTIRTSLTALLTINY